MANVHAFIAVFNSVVALFLVCDTPGENVFTDYACAAKPIYLTEKVVNITIGYFVYDTIISLFILKDYTPLGI